MSKSAHYLAPQESARPPNFEAGNGAAFNPFIDHSVRDFDALGDLASC